MAQVIRSKETGEEFVGDGPVPDGFEVVTANPTGRRGRRMPTMADIGGQMAKNAERQAPTLNPMDVGKAMVMPTAGAMVGRKLGSPLGMPGQMAGESIGAVVGTGANMAAGLQPPSLWDMGQAALSPLMGRVAGGLGRETAVLGAKMLPGSAAARHEIAKTTMDAIPDLVRPGTPSGALYKLVEDKAANVFINPQNLRNAVDDLIAHEAKIMPGLKDTTRQSMLSAIAGEVADPAKTMPFVDYWANVKRIGEKVGALQTSGGEALGAAKVLYRAAQADLAAAESAYPMLRSANDAFKRELAAESLEKVVKTQGVLQRQDGLVQLKPQAIRKWLANPANADEVKMISKDELSAIHATLTKIEKLPVIPPPTGVMHGSGPFLARAAGGGLLGTAVGGPSGGAVGAMAATLGSQLVSRALMTDIGRKALMKVLDRGAFLDYPHIAALAVAINAGTKAQAREQAATE